MVHEIETELAFDVTSREQVWTTLHFVERAIRAVTDREIAPYCWRGGDHKMRMLRHSPEDLSIVVRDGWADPDPSFAEALLDFGNGRWVIGGYMNKYAHMYRVTARFASHDQAVADATVAAVEHRLSQDGLHFRRSTLDAPSNSTGADIGRVTPRVKPKIRREVPVPDRPPRDLGQNTHPHRGSKFREMVTDHALRLFMTVLGGLLVLAAAAALGLPK